jgi:hypothetical protein
MAGWGFAKYANTILKENRNLRKKKSMFEKERRFLNLSSEESRIRGFETTDKHASKSLLTQIRLNEQEKTRKEVLAIIWGIGLTLIVFLFIMDYVYQNDIVNSEVNQANQEKLPEEKKEKEEKYLYYISSGDDWFRKQEYYNAAFQYRLARELYPSDTASFNRLKMAYKMNCKVDQRNCDRYENLLTLQRKR